eukprot:3391853-Rhodomonas_salina.1
MDGVERWRDGEMERWMGVRRDGWGWSDGEMEGARGEQRSRGERAPKEADTARATTMTGRPGEHPEGCAGVDEDGRDDGLLAREAAAAW